MSLDQFSQKNQWTWSYSERDEITGDWKSPYLYETYQVVEKKGSVVTIEMSSHEDLNKKTKPHHKFIVDIEKCLEAGQNLGRFMKFKISFYTMTLENQWTLLSHHHKALAFTEKFNCYWGKLKKVEKWEESLGVPLFQWRGSPVRSWYIEALDQYSGVAFERETGQYRMELVQ